MSSPVATFGLLHALGRMSPKAALVRAARRSPDAPGAPTPEWTKATGIELEPASLAWHEGETPCTVDVLRSAGRGSSAAYCFLTLRFPHPSKIVHTLLDDGIPLLCEMTRRALWAEYAEPLESFVVVGLDLGGDFAQYVLGDSFEELGSDQFRRALGAYRRAERDGWPGWAEAGVQVLELPRREEE